MARKASVLSEEQKKQIAYVYYDLDYSGKEISEFYGIHEVTVYNILKKMECPPKKNAGYRAHKEQAKNNRREIYEDYLKSGIKYPATYCKKTNAKYNALVLSSIISESEDETTKLEVEVQNTVAEEPIVTEPQIRTDEDIKRVNVDTHVYCTFFADRHDFPDYVTKSIYNTKGLDSFKMFDMDFLYKKSVEFIESNITFDKDGNAERDIVIFMSGLQSVTGAIVRACVDHHVNLTFMHYNKETDEWYKQEVINGNKSSSTLLSKFVDCVSSIPEYSKYKYDDLFICGDVDLSETFYIVKISYCDDCDNVYNSQGYICSDGWIRFGKFAEQMLSVPIRTRVMLLQVNLDETYKYGFKFRGPIANSFNMPKINKEEY